MKRGYAYYEDQNLGRIYVVVNESGLEEIFLLEDHFNAYLAHEADLKEDHKLCSEALLQLKQYFEGTRTGFDLPLDIHGTSFREKVWQVLKEIPYGETISYKEVAERIGNPKAVRAVGGAVGANPVPLVIPCHRVIGANGKMVGFMGPSHTDIKEKLLAHEIGHVGKMQLGKK